MAQFAAWAGRAVHIQGIAHHDQLGLLLGHLPRNFLYYRFPVAAVEYPYGAGQQLAAVADGKPGPGIAVIHRQDTHGFPLLLCLRQGAGPPAPLPGFAGRSDGPHRGPLFGALWARLRGGWNPFPAKILLPLYRFSRKNTSKACNRALDMLK